MTPTTAAILGAALAISLALAEVVKHYALKPAAAAAVGAASDVNIVLLQIKSELEKLRLELSHWRDDVLNQLNRVENRKAEVAALISSQERLLSRVGDVVDEFKHHRSA